MSCHFWESLETSAGKKNAIALKVVSSWLIHTTVANCTLQLLQSRPMFLSVSQDCVMVKMLILFWKCTCIAPTSTLGFLQLQIGNNVITHGMPLWTAKTPCHPKTGGAAMPGVVQNEENVEDRNSVKQYPNTRKDGSNSLTWVLLLDGWYVEGALTGK